MSTPQVVFGQTVEGFFKRALRGRMTPELKQELRALGIAADGPFLAAYSIDVWMKGVRLTAATLYPELTFEQAAWRLGEDFVNGFAETTIGRAVFALLRLMGPMKALARIERNFRTGNNYITARFTQLGPTSAEIRLNEVHGEPWFNAGILKGGGKLVGAKDMVVEYTLPEGGGCTYRCRWDAA